MISYFTMNGYEWAVEYVDSNSSKLVDRTGERTLATTDPYTMTVYLSNALDSKLRHKVLIHELGHCAMISYGIIDDIHRMTKRMYWIEMEELICNIIADYGEEIFSIARDIRVVPFYIDRLVS